MWPATWLVLLRESGTHRGAAALAGAGRFHTRPALAGHHHQLHHPQMSASTPRAAQLSVQPAPSLVESCSRNVCSQTRRVFRKMGEGSQPVRFGV